MGDGLRTVHVVTADESLLASVRAAITALEGWEFARPDGYADLTAKPPAPGDVLLFDGGSGDRNVYEVCRELAGKTRCRTYVLVEGENDWAAPIARFCGATGVLSMPLTATALREALDAPMGRIPEPIETTRAPLPGAPTFPEALFKDIEGVTQSSLVSALIDPETDLFNYAFLNYKLDEEFKRAQRFAHPLACVMLGFEGEASEQTLRELAGLFLQASRDTDVLGRFDTSSFLFLLPNTGPDGAEIMATRIGEQALARELRDLVGDPLSLSVGISCFPHPDVEEREDLYSRAREAFLEAQEAGGGVVSAV